MTRTLMRRVEKLEQTMTLKDEARAGRGHWLISERGEDLSAKAAALRASEEWQDGDHITVWRIVDPPHREHAA